MAIGITYSDRHTPALSACNHIRVINRQQTHYCLIGVKSGERDCGDREARIWEVRAADRYYQIVKTKSAAENLMQDLIPRAS